MESSLALSRRVQTSPKGEIDMKKAHRTMTRQFATMENGAAMVEYSILVGNHCRGVDRAAIAIGRDGVGSQFTGTLHESLERNGAAGSSLCPR